MKSVKGTFAHLVLIFDKLVFYFVVFELEFLVTIETCYALSVSYSPL